ncbi:MAG: pyruvate:ferredoxin (flavodoxin) oxidoreductase [Bacteroidales bacterium]
MAKEKKFITCDGNWAAAHVAYMFSELAAIYPITPSSTMAEYVDEWSAYGQKNLFGETVKVIEMQSEGGAAGTLHGALQAGVLATTFTASQGLLLMIPNMYKIAGELLPTVFHVSARSLAAQALSIFGDHSDVMSARQTGFALLASGGVQEAMDLAAVAHLSTLKSRIPFVHFFDGFRTSHEIQKIEEIDQEELRKLISDKSLAAFRNRALNPNKPVTRGTAQNPDVYFQAREAANPYYDAVPDIVARYMGEIGEITGRHYLPFDYCGHPEAENIIIAMGSVCDTIKEVIMMQKEQGEKVGLLTVRLYRPFSAKYFTRVLPKSVKRIAVLDRTKEPGAVGEPLYLDVKSVIADLPGETPLVVGGRYGLSSKDTTPAQIVAVLDNLKMKEPKNGFTIGITDDVSFKSLPIKEEISIAHKGVVECKFYGLGSDGTVGANKNTIKIIGETTPKYVQAYFDYDSKKSGGYTCSHLRFGDTPINSPYLVSQPDFVACHVTPYLTRYNMLKGIKKGGTFLLNTVWSKEETLQMLPDFVKATIAKKELTLYIINATQIAEEIGLGHRTNTILQSAFFKIANIIPYETAVKEMKAAAEHSYGRKGEKILTMNNSAIDRGSEYQKVEIPAEWAEITAKFRPASFDRLAPDWVRNVADVVNSQEGDTLPVSSFLNLEDGTIPSGTAAFEKRAVASVVPEWQKDNCIQCSQCAYVCPHAAIRPFLMNEQEQAKAAEGLKRVPGNRPFNDYSFTIQVSPMDCTGCGNCAEVCPSKEKSLIMKPIEGQLHEQANFDWLHSVVGYKDNVQPKDKGLKHSQFAQPLFEFSGACAGCGETPYIKAITQLYGEKMMVANATGCSSIYGGSFPSSPYTTNKDGFGPAWANSLFEDNAEYGLGMHMGSERVRDRVAKLMAEGIGNKSVPAEAQTLFAEWLENRDSYEKSKEIANKVIPLLEGCKCEICSELVTLKEFIAARSQWIFGGDGWAYDIGYGGLDHVLASGENVNVLVMDTEVYSNTGGQSSKATPTGAVAKFATSGKKIRKKDLGMMAISYGYVYVAQVAMGASQNQLFRVLKEAEAYDGPSLIIAYSPCINHGIRSGMGTSQRQEKLAVEAGYWHLYRYNPTLEAEGKNPFILDSKEPDWSKFQDFLGSEVRYTSLKGTFPQEAEQLFKLTEEHAKWRYNSYKRLATIV